MYIEYLLAGLLVLIVERNTT